MAAKGRKIEATVSLVPSKGSFFVAEAPLMAPILGYVAWKGTFGGATGFICGTRGNAQVSGRINCRGGSIADGFRRLFYNNWP